MEYSLAVHIYRTTQKPHHRQVHRPQTTMIHQHRLEVRRQAVAIGQRLIAFTLRAQFCLQKRRATVQSRKNGLCIWMRQRF